MATVGPQRENLMRVVSMVPSWTETLLEAQVEVVGRTRFCIHPQDRIRQIPAIGGTKDIQLERLHDCHPDLMILDQEENPKSMAELGIPFFASHIQRIQDVAPALEQMATKLENRQLLGFARRWQNLPKLKSQFVQNLPALEWLTPPPVLFPSGDFPEGESDSMKDSVSGNSLIEGSGNFERVYYVIWTDPWMVVSAETFIGSVLQYLGAGESLPCFEKKYPSISWQELNQPGHLLLFSSEPYPFLKKKDKIPSPLFASAAIVDGEKMSWFGVRTLRFLESLSDRG